MIRDVLHDSRFTNRAIFGLFEFLGNGYGVAFSSGEVSRAKRRLALTTLRHFGVGKTVFAQGIEQQIEMMLQHIETQRHENRPLYLQAKELKELRFGFIKEMKEFFEARKPKDKKEFLTEEPICVADYIWSDLMQYKNEAYPFPEHDTPFILTDMFMAGQETTTMTLSWAILLMMHHPDIQDKIYEDLKAEFPDKSQIIPLSGLNTCDFTCATIQEVQRVTPVLSSTIDHTASKFEKNMYLMPFPVGTRACPGKNIAKMELFLVFANILRK
ncbi:cytochrome P450 2J4-like [Symsagittifera roscoffensis]|uniref:cytochrome P450 2J4-like n=1 Tax=Symsagittifera roscoffensis TaxID=84072 RepID=UPI00307C9237